MVLKIHNLGLLMTSVEHARVLYQTSVGLVQVSFQDVHMRYRPGLPLVLKGLTITIQPGTNCGIVGRTGELTDQLDCA